MSDAYSENAAWDRENPPLAELVREAEAWGMYDNPPGPRASPPLDAETVKAIMAERELDHGHKFSEPMFEQPETP